MQYRYEREQSEPAGTCEKQKYCSFSLSTLPAGRALRERARFHTYTASELTSLIVTVFRYVARLARVCPVSDLYCLENFFDFLQPHLETSDMKNNIHIF